MLAATFANNSVDNSHAVTANQVIVESSSEFSEKEIDSKQNTQNPLRNKTTSEVVREYFKDTPIMAEVAYCESNHRQFDENGNVLRGRVNSQDVGVMQINEKYHLGTSQKLGINIYTLEGNLEYGKYLYDTQGVAPWVYSKPCWGNKTVAVAK